MLINYNKFYKELQSGLLLEQYINESVLYFLPSFKKKIRMIDHPIAKDLLNIHGEDIEKDMTFINVGQGDNKVTFNKMSNVEKNLNTNYYRILKNKEIDDIDDIEWYLIYDDVTKNSSEIKIGRFIKKIFGDEYSEKQIEEFVNLYKSEAEDARDKFKIVEGDDIAFWYKGKNYYNTNGNLGNSCMRNVGSDIFDIYTENPDVVKMLILVKEGFIKGRALVWKIENKDVEFEYLMDRVYVNYDSDYYKFIKYAKDNDWGYKTYNSYDTHDEIGYDDEEMIKDDITVRIKDIEYSSFPYMDTFKIYVKDINTLFNKTKHDINIEFSSDFNEIYFLENDNGEYELINQVIDYHTGEVINTNEAIYSKCVDDFIKRDEAVKPILHFVDDGTKIDFIKDDDCYRHVDDPDVMTWVSPRWAIVLGCRMDFGMSYEFTNNHKGKDVPNAFVIEAVRINKDFFLTKNHIKLFDEYKDYLDETTETIDKFEYYYLLRKNNILNKLYKEMKKVINTNQTSFDKKLSNWETLQNIFKTNIKEIDSNKFGHWNN